MKDKVYSEAVRLVAKEADGWKLIIALGVSQGVVIDNESYHIFLPIRNISNETLDFVIITRLFNLNGYLLPVES